MSRGRADRAVSRLAALRQASLRHRVAAGIYEDALARELGLNRSDLVCAEVLAVEGPMTAGRLAEVTGLTTGGISGVLDRLEREGHIQRASDPGDRRRVRLRLTPSLRDRLDARLADLDQRAGLARLSDQHADAVLKQLARSAEALRDATVSLREAGTERELEPEAGLFFAPRAGRREAWLELVGGGHTMRVEAGERGGELFRARFDGRGVRVALRDDRVTVRSRARMLRGPSRGTLILHPQVRWGVRLRGGAGRVDADLAAVPLSGIEVSGGTGQAHFVLPIPRGEVPVRIDGGAREIVLERPAGTAMRIGVRGALRHFRIDGEDRGRTGALEWVTGDGCDTADAYAVSVRGGLNRLELRVSS